MSTLNRAQLLASREELVGVRELRQQPMSAFEIREVPNGTGGTNLRFTGYGSVTCVDERDDSHAYDMEYMAGPYREGILRGAFKKTLADGADVAFLVNHTGVSMARSKAKTLTLTEDTTGLHVDAMLNPSRPDVQILRAAIEDGALDEMSFAFRVVRQKWVLAKPGSGDIDRRWIAEVNLNHGDVAAVNFGANPHTGGLVAVRNRLLADATSGGCEGRPSRAALSGEIEVMRSEIQHSISVTYLDLAEMRR